MHCPHCRNPLPAHRPVTDPKRLKLHGHHGEMDLDAEQFQALARTAWLHLSQRRAMLDALRALERYREIVERMELEPAFAEHVLG